MLCELWLELRSQLCRRNLLCDRPRCRQQLPHERLRVLKSRLQLIGAADESDRGHHVLPRQTTLLHVRREHGAKLRQRQTLGVRPGRGNQRLQECLRIVQDLLDLRQIDHGHDILHIRPGELVPLQPRLEDRPHLIESELLEVSLVLELVHNLKLRLDVVDGVLEMVARELTLVLLRLGSIIHTRHAVPSSAAADQTLLADAREQTHRLLLARDSLQLRAVNGNLDTLRCSKATAQ